MADQRKITFSMGVDGKPTETTCFSLDDLLSERALKLLNDQGFVCFKIFNEDGSGSNGWFSRKTTKVIEREMVVISRYPGVD